MNMNAEPTRDLDDRRPISLSKRRTFKRSEVIARDLAQHIIDANLPAGAMLPREHDMIEQLGVGRTTLREALRILENRGVLTIRSGPGGGPVVRHPDPADLTQTLLLILQFQRATMLEVLEARIWIESAAARMAAPHITKAEIQKLREINQEMIDLVDNDDTSISDANQRFHRGIANASGNIIVQTFVETLMSVADSGIADLTHSTEFKREATEGHLKVLEAFEAKDPAAAEEAMRHHVSAGKNGRVAENPALMSRPLRWTD